MLALIPSARLAHIGVYRDRRTLEAVEYYFKALHRPAGSIQREESRDTSSIPNMRPDLV
jgi:uracil phosphoribosyltransferase